MRPGYAQVLRSRRLAPRQYVFDPVGDRKSDLFNLWRYRRIANRANVLPGTYAGDLPTVNRRPNDCLRGNLVGGL
jgi:hypothetical protein